MHTILLLGHEKSQIQKIRAFMPDDYRLIVASDPEALPGIVRNQRLSLVVMPTSLDESMVRDFTRTLQSLDFPAPIMSIPELGANDWTIPDTIIKRITPKPVGSQIMQSTGNDDPVLWGTSSIMQKLRQRLAIWAQSEQAILLEGETGAGKEICARYIHLHSPRARHVFQALNCGGIAPGLLETELFGCVAGAYTQATDRAGWIESAHKGTLMLDEIGELSPSQQTRLLRFLDHGSISRVGSCREIQCEPRIIAASNRLLDASGQASGRFRKDLLYRFDLRLRVPPLREHAEDIPDYARRFLGQCISSNPAIVCRDFTVAALDRLASAPWPGNLRQLRSVIRTSASACHSEVISAGDLVMDDFLSIN